MHTAGIMAGTVEYYSELGLVSTGLLSSKYFFPTVDKHASLSTILKKHSEERIFGCMKSEL